MSRLVVLVLVVACLPARTRAQAAVPDAPEAYREAGTDGAPLDARIRSDWPGPARRRAFLHLVSDDELTVHLREGTAWREICTTPCDAALLRGPIELAVSRDGSTPAELEDAVVERDGAWALELEDRSRSRGTALPLGILAAVLLPSAIALLALAGDLDGDSQGAERALAVTGGIVGVAGGVVCTIAMGFALGTPDAARSRVLDDDAP